MLPEGNILQNLSLLVVREADVLELDLALAKGERRGSGLVLREGTCAYDVCWAGKKYCHAERVAK